MSYTNSFDGSESGVFLMEPKQSRSDRRSGEHRRWLEKLRANDRASVDRQVSDSRLAKIRRIREQIQNGTYETEAKWQVAVDRLLRDLNK